MKSKPTANQAKQAIIWGRFSSDRQADGDSIRKLLLKDVELSADEIIKELQTKFPKIDIKAQLEKMADPERGKGGLNKSSSGKYSIKK